MNTRPITEITSTMIKVFFPEDKELLDWFVGNELEGLPIDKMCSNGYPQTDKLVDVFVRGGAVELMNTSIAHRQYRHSLSEVDWDRKSTTGNYTKTIYHDEFLGRNTRIDIHDYTDDEWHISMERGFDDQGNLASEEVDRKAGDYTEHLTRKYHKGEVCHVLTRDSEGDVTEVLNTHSDHKTYEELPVSDSTAGGTLYVYKIDASVYEVYDKHGKVICSIDKTGWDE